MNEVYISILNRITSVDAYRDWLRYPFNAYGKSFATNSYSLVATPLCGDFVNHEDKLKNIYPLTPNMDKLITLDLLREKLATFPLIDCFDETEQKCKACDGSGMVDFEFYFDRNCYETESDCPVCEGEGNTLQISDIPNGKKELDYSKFFCIGNSDFYVGRIEELIFVAEALKSDVRLIYQTMPNKASLFAIGDVELLLMPTMRAYDETPTTPAVEISL